MPVLGQAKARQMRAVRAMVAWAGAARGCSRALPAQGVERVALTGSEKAEAKKPAMADAPNTSG